MMTSSASRQVAIARQGSSQLRDSRSISRTNSAVAPAAADDSNEISLEDCLFGGEPVHVTMKPSDFAKQAKESDSEASPSALEAVAPVSSKWADCASDESAESPLHRINLKNLRKICSAGGIHEDDETGASFRGVAWRVLIGYLPDDTTKWQTLLTEKRRLYIEFVTELFEDTADATETANQLRGVRRRGPLDVQPSQSSRRLAKKVVIPEDIKNYWKKKSLDENILERLARDLNALQMNIDVSMDTEDDNAEAAEKLQREKEEKIEDFSESALLLDEIRKDVVRTHPDLAFFLDPSRNLGRRRYAALERILFVWSKHNKGVRYVQGMNEIVGIIYYVLANDQNEEWSVWAEADTYWLFHILLAEMSDVFVPGMDDHDTGIQGRITAMQTLLARHDPEVKEHMDDVGIEVAFYAIRWWTTLLSREFLLPDTIRLWDSMFASTHKDNFLRYVCVTMVMTMRDQLLKGDFSRCLKLLHAFPPTNVEVLLEASRSLWVYESQISLACHRGGLSLQLALTTIESPRAIIMAFGFPGGTPPISRSDQFEKARVKAEATLRGAANGVFGRAKGMYSSWSSKTDSGPRSTQQDRPNSGAGKALALGRASDDDDDGPLSASSKQKTTGSDDVYLQAILKSSSK